MINPLHYEGVLYNQGYKTIGGIDEAGRGPLAGPVVACALVFPQGLVIDGVDDSKKLSAKKRMELCKTIKECALSIGIGFVDAQTIDEINILLATLLAMQRAASNMGIKPDAFIIDGTHKPDIESAYCLCLPKADSLSHTVAAASIIAKTERDTYMESIHNKYPQYGFGIHKGYGTKAHIEAIKKFGSCAEHRESFKVKRLIHG